MSNTDLLTVADDLLLFIDSSPTPFHAVAEAARRLTAAGFDELHADADWEAVVNSASSTKSSGWNGFVIRGGALVAWSVPAAATLDAPFRIFGAHTDSPNLRIRPQPDQGFGAWQQLGVEVYGGALVNSWLDRDLGLAGRVAVETAEGTELRLLRIDRPLLRVPQLAIHLDRDIHEKGLQLNREQHLTPVWSTGPVDPGGFQRFLADELEVAADQVMAWDLMAFDVTPATRAGRYGEFISAARLDNLCSCFVGIESLISCDQNDSSISVVSLFDHEEVGSVSATGANGAFLNQLLERVSNAWGSGRAGHLRALASSSCLSADMAHATHPNYPERHQLNHPVFVNSGPVVKVNNNQRYATDSVGHANFARACAEADVPMQIFVSRNDMPCGSTIGPTTAAHLGVPTLDVGLAMLAMHSIRELAGSSDPAMMISAVTQWMRS